MPLLLPLMMSELKLSYLEVGLAVSVFFVSYALFQLPVGFIARRVDKRYLLGPGLALSCVGMMLTSFTSNFPQLLIFQAVAGLGGSTHHPLTLAIISNIFTRNYRGRALGFHGFAGSTSFFVTPFAVSSLANFGWRIPFLLVPVPGLIIAILLSVLLSEKPGSRVAQKVSLKFLAGSRPLLRASTMFGLFSMTERGIVTFIPLFLTVLYPLGLTEASYLFAVVFLLGIVSQPLAGYVSDKVSRKKLSILFFLAASCVIIVLSLKPPVYFILPVLACMGFTLFGLLPLADTVATDLIPESIRGEGLGFYSTVGVAIGALSPTVTGHVIESMGFQPAYLILALVLLVSIPLLLTASLRGLPVKNGVP